MLPISITAGHNATSALIQTEQSLFIHKNTNILSFPFGLGLFQRNTQNCLDETDSVAVHRLLFVFIYVESRRCVSHAHEKAILQLIGDIAIDIGASSFFISLRVQWDHSLKRRVRLNRWCACLNKQTLRYGSAETKAPGRNRPNSSNPLPTLTPGTETAPLQGNCTRHSSVCRLYFIIIFLFSDVFWCFCAETCIPSVFPQ